MTISVSGTSYRLTSSLLVPDANTDGINFSTSLITKLASPKVNGTSSLVVIVALLPSGTSLTGVMFSVTVSVSVRAPPEPVLPASLVVTVSVTEPLALSAVV